MFFGGGGGCAGGEAALAVGGGGRCCGGGGGRRKKKNNNNAGFSWRRRRMKAPLNTAQISEGAIRCGCGSGSGPNTHEFIYLGTGAKGGDPPKNKIKTKPLAFCSGVNHGGLGGNPLTPNPTKPVQGVEADGAPETNNRCKNRGKIKYRGGTTNAPSLAARSTKLACTATNYRGAGKSGRVFTNRRAKTLGTTGWASLTKSFLSDRASAAAGVRARGPRRRRRHAAVTTMGVGVTPPPT